MQNFILNVNCQFENQLTCYDSQIKRETDSLFANILRVFAGRQCHAVAHVNSFQVVPVFSFELQQFAIVGECTEE